MSDLAIAAYCPRKLYYTQQADDRTVPESVRERRDLAFRYDELLAASNASLSAEPIDVAPVEYRTNLERSVRTVDRFDDLANPDGREVLHTGRTCRGIVHKVLTDPPEPSMISTGTPPKQGVWEPDSVRAVAAAKALAWTREHPVDRAYVEYPTHGVVRPIEITARRRATYRRAVQATEAIDGQPPRLRGRSKCRSCEFRERCGVRSRSLRSLLFGAR
jgi:CRISPR-associated exonuclease Cas4